MRGLLADVNVQGQLARLVRALESLQLMEILKDLDIRLVTFRDLGLDRRMADRPLWGYCQEERWVLLTDNRNDDGLDSLGRTLADSWVEGHLPVLTLATRGRFENDRDYAGKVAEDVATVLFSIASDRSYCDRPRIYVPFQWP